MITLFGRPGEGLFVTVRLEITLKPDDFQELVDKVSFLVKKGTKSKRQIGSFFRRSDAIRYLTASARNQLPLELRLLEAAAKSEVGVESAVVKSEV